MANFNAQTIKGSKTAVSGTFAEDEINMPKMIGSNIPAIIGLEIQHPNITQAAETVYSKWHISVHSEDDIRDIDDSYIIDADQKWSADNDAAGETNGAQDLVQRITFPAPIPVSSQRIYFGFKQLTGSDHTYKYKIWWVPRYIKGVKQQDNMFEVSY